MTAVQQVESHDGLAQGNQGLIHRVVGGCARKRLHVDIDLVRAVTVGSEGLGRAAAGQRLDHVGILHAFVIARVAVAAVLSQAGGVVEDLVLAHPARFLVRVAFGVDVLEGRAERLAHGQRRGRLGGDQNQFARLALGLQLGQLVHVGVEFLQRASKQIIGHFGLLVRVFCGSDN